MGATTLWLSLTVEVYIKKILSEEVLIKNLKEAIEGEMVAGIFYKYLSKYILNNKVREEFEKMADEEAEEHKDLLIDRLRERIGYRYEPDMSKLDIKGEADNVFLVDVFKMAKDAESLAVKFYKEAKKQDDPKYKKMYDDIIKDEKKHWRLLDRERKSMKKKIQYNDVDGLRLFSYIKSFVNLSNKRNK